ncbi:PIN domain-containing protein [Candidatus Venteria ishoeyi]|uniref:tRNA(fMet)-specific endonuclease VapC n=1 Tax=Candidatus Venteria ishoeyi TaxID=1899563 RepID=A0A1H6FB46_9GAMM|nr:PIN domain-containing protein [Candidatus Venteria ishoeyi]SEH07312.1 tRNA(fMet)-specific endonuclease VapC [Candidatus Venteria ishoeyi]
MKYLLDTNTLSYLLRGDSAVRSAFITVRDNEQSIFLYSPVVDYEIRRYLLLKGATRNLAQYETLIANWEDTGFDREDWFQAASLWAKRHRIGMSIADADLLIAVNALRHDAILVTNNQRHFTGLDLHLENWFEISPPQSRKPSK